MLLVIKNVKTFNSDVLNDLVHLIQKYREHPHNLKLNLMLGMGQSSADELYQKLTIQSCVKLQQSKFFFPSMKSTIFEIVYKIVMNQELLLVFSSRVIRQLIENIQVFGLSIDKFRRVIRLLFAEFFQK